MIPVLEVEDGSPRAPSALKVWTQNIAHCYKELGIDIDSRSLHRHRLNLVGFEDIVEVRMSWPLNTWPEDHSNKELGT
jgi:hypothetical protein